MLCDSFDAIHIVWLATFHFYLDGCVGNAEIVFEFFRNGAQDVLSTTHALLVDHDVAATTDHAGADGPDMQIVYGQHAMHVRYSLLNLSHVHPCRNRL